MFDCLMIIIGKKIKVNWLRKDLEKLPVYRYQCISNSEVHLDIYCFLDTD